MLLLLFDVVVADTRTGGRRVKAVPSVINLYQQRACTNETRQPLSSLHAGWRLGIFDQYKNKGLPLVDPLFLRPPSGVNRSEELRAQREISTIPGSSPGFADEC